MKRAHKIYTFVIGGVDGTEPSHPYESMSSLCAGVLRLTQLPSPLSWDYTIHVEPGDITGEDKLRLARAILILEGE
jgi:hypothetical protein